MHELELVNNKTKNFNLFISTTMNKKQKIVTALLLIASMKLGSLWYAEWIDNILPVEGMDSVVSCPSVAHVYLSQDNDGDTIPDAGLYLNNNFILRNSTLYSYSAGQIMREYAGDIYTKVKYYTPLANMIYKVDGNNVVGFVDNTTFWRASWVFPYNIPVRWIATTPNKVVFEKPADNDVNKNIISIIYDYRYKYAQWFDWTISSAYRYNQVPSMWYMANTGLNFITLLPWSSGNRKRNWSSVQPAMATNDICRNYQLHRCGDGVVNTSNSSYVSPFTWETCDDGALNGTAWHCPLGCGIAKTERCGDEIIQPAGTFYNGNTNTMSFEDCDWGDAEWDTDGVLNGDDPQKNFCTSICLAPFIEIFTEEFVNI